MRSRAWRCTGGSASKGGGGLRLDLHEAALAPLLAEIGVAQNRHQPGLEVGAGRELIGVDERAQNRLLHEIIGEDAAAGEAPREILQSTEMLNDIILKSYGHRSSPS